MRALRVDKSSLAALEATLRLYLPPFDPVQTIPVLQMLSAPLAQVESRAITLTDALTAKGISGVALHESAAYVGGGSLPDQALPSFAVSLRMPDVSANDLATALRRYQTPIIVRIERDHVMLDMRTVWDGELPALTAAIEQISTG